MENEYTSEQMSPHDPASTAVTPSVPSKHKTPIIIAGIVLLLFVVAGIFFLASNSMKLGSSIQQNQNVNTSTTATLTPEPTIKVSGIKSEIVDVNELTKKYINKEYGFALPYSKYVLGRNDCHDYEMGNFNGKIPLKVFEDVDLQKIYVAEEMFMEVNQSIARDGVIKADYTTCKVIPTTLNLIKNNPNEKIYENNSVGRSGPSYLEFSYKRINNDSDLDSFAQLIYGCNAGTKQLIKDSNDIYQIRLIDKTGGAACNFVYYFRYSPENHVAVITGGYQEALDWPNEQREPIIEFISK